MKRIMRPLCAAQACLIILSALPMESLSASPSQVDKTPDFAPFILDKRVEREDYNLRFGPVFVDIVGTFGIEYNDNINTSEVDPISDFILQPGISLGFKWQMNENTEVDLNIGMEYWYYLSEDDLNEFNNSFGLTPNTELSFRVMVGDVAFRVYDRLQYSFDSADSVVVDSVTGSVVDNDPEAFTRYRNVLGIQTEWFIRETAFSAQLSREDVYSPEDIFSYVNRHENKIALNAEHPLAANFLIGAGTSYAQVDFREDVNNDGTIFTFGPYFDWKVTEVIGLYAGIAFNDWDYDEGALTDTFGDKSNLQDYTWMVRLSHVANSVFNHQIEWYRAFNVSNTANFNIIDGIRYTASYNLTPRIRLDGAIGYEESESSGGLLVDDDFDRWVAGISTEVVLGPRLTAEIGYRYIDKESDATYQSYEQNQFRIFFKYDF
ncbi:hypothetical protein ACWPKO_06330 [Coraliomargarita sp. W4R53]